MTIEVRHYRPEDRPACWHVFYRAVREGAAGHYSEGQRAAWAPTPLPALDGYDKLGDQICFVAVRDGTAVGFMSLERTGYLDMAFVLPGEMGKGTATALYRALVAEARQLGLTRLTVHASHLARRFFLKQGWRVVWMENHAADGEVFERFLMALDLEPQGADCGERT
ncbi:GNAT family N-acetyltransferase [Frigidibacter sp. SD6-1]|uniref:GNAT family N-acetyltransferase n=1 Tax=Frigidibacter sp. SD6-1 TaxID=3032581 RepID=UPI0024DF34F5|nr:GNAT family N-acetyltransferase [Frigidibacter sp. SD6-1]